MFEDVKQEHTIDRPTRQDTKEGKGITLHNQKSGVGAMDPLQKANVLRVRLTADVQPGLEERLWANATTDVEDNLRRLNDGQNLGLEGGRFQPLNIHGVSRRSGWATGQR
jgi:hypothetical protein